jgi:hypothetical protein
MSGARYEIAVDGRPLSYCDLKPHAIEPPSTPSDSIQTLASLCAA